MSTLLLRLEGPMQSWGTQSRFSVRDTGMEPSKSGVIGVLCAALGRPREEPLADLAGLHMGVRVDHQGVLRREYQTSGGTHLRGDNYGIVTADGKSRRASQSSRYYLADASFLVGLEGDEDLLRQLDAALAAPVMAAEWFRLTRGYLFARTLGLVYGIAALLAMLWLRHQPALGRETVLWLTACVWSTDIAAYFVGSSVGGAKLAPQISPGKTWSGLIGAIVVTALASTAFGVAVGEGQPLMLGVVGAILAVVGQMGDLLKSSAKRRAGVKDSGRLIPGHGGLLDRFDGFMAVLLVVALARLLFQGAWPWT